MATSPKQSVLSLLEEFVHGIDKKASDGEVGETKPATQGERSSENSADVKKTTPNNVDSAGSPDSSPGGEKTPALSKFVVKATSTGPDGVPKTKTNKDDPGSASEARADNEKIAAQDAALELGNSLLADIVILTKNSAAAGKLPVNTPAAVKPKAATGKAAEPDAASANIPDTGTAKTAADTETLAKAAAFDRLSGMLVGQNLSQTILATSNAVQATTDNAQAAQNAQLTKAANDEIARVASLGNQHAHELAEFYAGIQKGAADAGMPPGGDPTGGLPPGGPPPGMDPAAAGGAPGAGGPPGAGGMPPEQLLAALEELAQKLGMSPEDLIQVIEQELSGGGAGGPGGPGGPPDAGGAPAGGPPAAGPAAAAPAADTGGDSKPAPKDKASDKGEGEGDPKEASAAAVNTLADLLIANLQARVTPALAAK